MEAKNVLREATKTPEVHLIWRTGKRLVFGRAASGKKGVLGLFSTDYSGNWRFHLDKAWLFGGEKDYLTVRRDNPRDNSLIIQNRGELAVKVLLRDESGEIKEFSVPEGKEWKIPAHQEKVIQIGDLPLIKIEFDN